MNFAKHSTNTASSETARHLPLTSEGPTGVPPSTEASLNRPLTDREKQTLRLVCDGLSNAMIARRLGVSPETTKSELKRIFRKIEVKNRTQAAVLLVRQGLA